MRAVKHDKNRASIAGRSRASTLLRRVVFSRSLAPGKHRCQKPVYTDLSIGKRTGSRLRFARAFSPGSSPRTSFRPVRRILIFNLELGPRPPFPPCPFSPFVQSSRWVCVLWFACGARIGRCTKWGNPLFLRSRFYCSSTRSIRRNDYGSAVSLAILLFGRRTILLGYTNVAANLNLT